MSFFKRGFIVLLLCFFLTNSFFITKNSVKACASPLAAVELAEGTVGMLGLTVSAPAVVAVASTLALAGVCWHYRSEIEGVAGWIASNVSGAIVKSGAELYVDAKKVVNSYNEMRSKGSVASVSVKNNVQDLPFGVLIKGNPNDPDGFGYFVKLHKGESFYIPVPAGMEAYCDGVTLTQGGLWKDGKVNGDYFGAKMNFNLGDKYHFIDSYSQGQFLLRWCYYRVKGNNVWNFPTALFRGNSVCVDFPKNLDEAKNIGNDTFVKVPENVSISADSIVNQTAREIADSVPISVSRGEAGVAVPAGKVLTNEGSIPLTGEGSISIPTTAEGDITAEKDTTKDDTMEKDTTKDDTISKTLDFNPILKIGSDLKDIFPFCVPFDIVRGIKGLVVPAKAPFFKYDFDKRYFIGGGHFEIDFSKFEVWAEIVRYFIAFGFSIFIVIKTRELIKG